MDDAADSRPDSPTTVDGSLEYITVDKYQWPQYEPPKRRRLDEEERRRRHREGQRRFMARKRRLRLQAEADSLKRRLNLLLAIQEEKLMREHQSRLRLHLASAENGEPACEDWLDWIDVEELLQEVVVSQSMEQ